MSAMSPRRPRSETTIIRAAKSARYFAVLNSVFSDEQLSWEARGLLGYLLSKPDDWKVRIFDVVRRGPAGQHKIRRMLRELEQFGYLHRRRFRCPDGTFTWTVTVYEDPSLGPQKR